MPRKSKVLKSTHFNGRAVAGDYLQTIVSGQGGAYDDVLKIGGVAVSRNSNAPLNKLLFKCFCVGGTER